jgi:hypothetical protein
LVRTKARDLAAVVAVLVLMAGVVGVGQLDL